MRRRPIVVLLAIVAFLLVASGCFVLYSPQVSAEPSPEAATEDGCDFRALGVGASPGSDVTVSDYAATLQMCSRQKAPAQVAIRSMTIGGQRWLLLANPQSLQTEIEKAACWTCQATDDQALQATRLVRSASLAASMPGIEHRTFLQNAGLQRGAGQGDFVTGDLCPSRRPLDRRFFAMLSPENKPTPIGLSISGLWLKHHKDDFQWLQDQVRAGVLDIVWINHTYTHPYASKPPYDHAFMLKDGVNPDFEILETEKLLISNGGIPSVFFRFPGLISSDPLMQAVRKYHLISLGAEAWLAKGQRPQAGSIILVHPNGNEEIGLDIFEKLYEQGKVAKPIQSIVAAP